MNADCFHIHILARFKNDGDRVRVGWQERLLARTELDELALRIRQVL